ncbi:hypothetical protein GCM10028806_29720 [Spirosoma terrae]|uniref:Uncharacterized protein n=1 Tax=Spirosoma terrae TaxID=1968276 RepID=A0A6L9LH86_9BACT|nr:hypothetical protein [Spirosoma terrae]NDU99097.1 hypothetical protein [Spirosoma terrae]
MSVSLNYKVVKVLNDDSAFRHIHGLLDFKIDNVTVPYMGYFGAEDVCFNTWFEELSNVIVSYRQGEKTYLFDEGEQGQPAYQFDFEDGLCFLSIIDSPISAAEGDPDWQKVKFEMADLVATYDEVKVGFLNEVQVKAPDALSSWKDVLKA